MRKMKRSPIFLLMASREREIEPFRASWAGRGVVRKIVSLRRSSKRDVCRHFSEQRNITSGKRLSNLDALSEGMTDCQFRHVILFFPKTYEVIVNPSLILPCIVEIEIFRLYIIFTKLFLLKLCQVF